MVILGMPGRTERVTWLVVLGAIANVFADDQRCERSAAPRFDDLGFPPSWG
jgi:hypothetical protein